VDRTINKKKKKEAGERGSKNPKEKKRFAREEKRRRSHGRRAKEKWKKVHDPVGGQSKRFTKILRHGGFRVDHTCLEGRAHEWCRGREVDEASIKRNAKGSSFRRSPQGT